MAAPITEPLPKVDVAVGKGKPVDLLRYGVLALAGAGTLGAAYELAAERHWDGIQNVAWVAVAALAVAVCTSLASSPRLVLLTRVLALAVLGASLYGIAMHVLANMHAGHLSTHYGPAFKQLPPLERLWLGATKTVGKAPPLAPGMLAQAAMLVLLGTLGRRHVRDR